MNTWKQTRILTAFIAFIVSTNFIFSPTEARASWAPKKPAYQLIDAKGVLIGVVLADEQKGPVIHDDTVTVYSGGKPLRYNLAEPIGGYTHGETYFKGTNCEEPWFRLQFPEGQNILLNKKWYTADATFEIKNEDLRPGGFSFQDRFTFQDGSRSVQCMDSTNGGITVVGLPRTAVRLKEFKVVPDPATLTWPLKVVADKEVSGPLFFQVNFGGAGLNEKTVGGFYFSASEPYLFFDIVARNPTGKIIKTWRNQRTGLWGFGCVWMEKETVFSISKYSFSLLYKGKIVAKLP
jgi:hypothetical protein